MLQGWIRIRWKPKEWSYTVQMVKDEKTENNLKKWKKKIKEGRDIEVKYVFC